MQRAAKTERPITPHSATYSGIENYRPTAAECSALLQLDQRAYKPAEVAEICLCTERTVINEMERGRLRHVKLPSGRVCFPGHIYEYLDAAEKKAAENVEIKLAGKASP